MGKSDTNRETQYGASGSAMMPTRPCTLMAEEEEEEVRRTEEDQRRARTAGLGNQGAWIQWDCRGAICHE